MKFSKSMHNARLLHWRLWMTLLLHWKGNDKFGIKLLINCLPAQMNIEISKVSTNMQLSEAIS
jgi:hypothetical protein